ncbi:MAG: methylase of chemotaxis methyl-accepting protein [Fibrobacteres bacterium]|nr:methylase of chemotaxis methyl-accepting protein [Fibrobacterota bacterium]
MTANPLVPVGAGQQEGGSFPVVGIGASAGGLEAFTQLLSNLPDHPNMAFVLVQHLEPTHASHLREILSKSTGMPIQEVRDGMGIAADHIYIIPPNANMTMAHGVLHLTPRGDIRGAHLPIDTFLRSLAQDRLRHAIGVVLSGTGSDGTLGLAEIKAVGGITFAQEMDSAKYPAMPASAVAMGVVDIVLPPADIARELIRMGGHPYLGHAAAGDTGHPFAGSEKEFDRILFLLRAVSGVDFTHYRDTTLKRRILRRMALGKVASIADYARQIESDPAELKSLYQDILINVTRFFRDPKAFEALAETAFPQILKAKSPGDTIRVWVAGCATGEEAYSLAIAICEYQDPREFQCQLRIFASDISDIPALERARAGVYPQNIENDVSPARLRRFFVKEDGNYRINKEIREMCIFAKHDVTADPPFAKLDLISCRNLLIYMSSSLQRRIIPAFHYALNPGGFLMLGNSETVGRDTDLFSPVDAQLKIYSKKMAAARLPNLAPKGNAAEAKGDARPVQRAPHSFDFQQAADRLLLRKFVPPGVLVNKDMDVIQFRGRTSPFLEPPQGGTGLNLAKMAQENLSLEMRNAILECEKTAAPVRREGLGILDGRFIRRFNLEVLPISLPDAAEACFLVLFEETGDPASLPDPDTVPNPRGPAQVEEISLLRLELAAAKEYLQTIREQGEAATEEMKSSNEEMESSNEELQSTNEELETAKEELQSSNEELGTMNDELRTRNLEQGQLNDDLTNLLGSVQIPIIMLGSDLCIRRFTPAAGKSLRLANADVGRPIGNVRFAPAFDFEKHIAEALSSQQPVSLEARDMSGRWNALKIHPYRSADGKIEGAVVVLQDIDDLKRAQQRLQESGDYARSIVDTVREPLLILEEGLRIHSANLSYYSLFGTRPQDTEGKVLQEIGGGIWNIPELLALLERAPDAAGGFKDFEVGLTLAGKRTDLLLNARRLLQDDGRKRMTLLAIDDITERSRAQRDLRLLKFFSDQSPDPYYLADRAANLTYVNHSACAKLGYAETELLGMNLLSIEPGFTPERFSALFEDAQGFRASAFETEHAGKDGKRHPVECSATGVDFEGERFMLVIARDITERMANREALDLAEEKLRQSQKMEAIGRLAGGIAHDFNNQLTAINGYSAMCLEESPERGDMYHHLLEINKAGERAATLTRQLLAYSRKQVLVPKVLDLNLIVSNMHSMLNRLIGEHYRLDLALDGTLGLIKADPGQMEQVLINLVVNARDALPHGGEIALRTRNEILTAEYPNVFPVVPRGSYVVLSVSDNGIGMDAELQKRIFDPFFTTKEVGKGTGLGLSVVQGIITQSGGHIALQSEKGEGAVFNIFLPMEVAKQEGSPRMDEDRARPAKGTETVLLVEDEDTVRNFTRKVLEMQGYTVLEAENGERALQVNAQHQGIPIQLLVTDMIMPGLGGRQLAERFLASRPESRVLFMSGYSEEVIQTEDGQIERDGHFIQKPFNPADLANSVRGAMNLVSQAKAP